MGSAYGYSHIYLSLVSFLAIIPIPKVSTPFFSDYMKLLTVQQIYAMAVGEISKRLGSLGHLPWVTWVGILISPGQGANTDTDTILYKLQSQFSATCMYWSWLSSTC